LKDARWTPIHHWERRRWQTAGHVQPSNERHYGRTAESTKALADFLSQPFSGLGRPVVDKTSLNGHLRLHAQLGATFDQVLSGSAGGSASPEEADSLFERWSRLA